MVMAFSWDELGSDENPYKYLDQSALAVAQAKAKQRHHSHPIVDFDQLLEHIRPFGIYQKRLWILVAIIFDTIIGMNIAVLMFASSSPAYTCKDPLPEGESTNATINETRLDKCIRTVFQCTNLQFQDNKRTAVTEFKLYCYEERMIARMLFGLIQMVGIMVGAIFWGQIGELFGRKKVLICIYLSCIAYGITIFFTVSWQMYSILVFFVGSACGGFWCISFVTVQEIVGKKNRLFVAVLNGWPVSLMLSAFVSYLLKDYKNISITINLVGLPFVVSFLWIYESPRWLLQHGRYDDAKSVLTQIALANGVDKFPNIDKYIDLLKANQSKPKYYCYRHLFWSWDMTKHCLALMFSWFTVGCSLSGLSKDVHEIPGDEYFNGFIRALLNGFFVWSLLLLDKYCGRRRLHQISLIAGAMFGLCVMVIKATAAVGTKKYLITAFAVLGSAVLGPTWNIVYLYTVEVFPTVVRTLGNGLCSATARIGYVAAAGIFRLGIFWPPLNSLLFSLLALIGAAVSYCFLPETRHISLPETLPIKGDKKEKSVHFRDKVECKVRSARETPAGSEEMIILNPKVNHDHIENGDIHNTDLGSPRTISESSSTTGGAGGSISNGDLRAHSSDQLSSNRGANIDDAVGNYDEFMLIIEPDAVDKELYLDTIEEEKEPSEPSTAQDESTRDRKGDVL